MEQLIPGIIIALLLVGFFFFVTQVAEQQGRKKLEPLLPLLENGELKSSMGMVYLLGSLGGLPVKVALESGIRRQNQGPITVHFGSDEYRNRHNKPPTMRINLAYSFPAAFSLLLNNSLFDFGKNLGLIKDLEIGEPEFDRKFLVEGKDRLGVMNFLSSAKVRAVMDLEFTLLKFNSKELQLIDVNYSENQLEPEVFKQTLEKLQALTR